MLRVRLDEADVEDVLLNAVNFEFDEDEKEGRDVEKLEEIKSSVLGFRSCASPQGETSDL